MGLAVVTVASGGLPVVEAASGTPVTEAANLRGVPVTKVVGKPYGLPVTFETIGVGGGPGIWDAATATGVTLSNGSLTATNTGTTSVNQGVRLADAAGKISGKIYFELLIVTVSGAGQSVGIGVGTIASTFTSMGNNATVGAEGYITTRTIWSNGSSSGSTIATGGIFAGSVMGIAADLDNRRIWLRPDTASNWNNNVANNPATNVGGVVIPAGTMVPFLTFGGTGGAAGNVFTANFGATAFSGAVPSGFTGRWTA